MVSRIRKLFKNESRAAENGFKKKNAAEHDPLKVTSYSLILSENSETVYGLVKGGMKEREAFKHLQVSLTLQNED